jgi:hypothetical protein
VGINSVTKKLKMQKEKQITLKDIKPLSNYVLLKIKHHNDKLIINEDLTLWLDTSFTARHTSVACTVLKTPDKLLFGHEVDPNISMPHETTIEVKEGDTVIVNFLAVYNAFNDVKVNNVMIDGDMCFFVKYSDMFVAKREWTKTETDVFWKFNKDLSEDKIKELEENNIILEGDKVFSIIPLNGNVLCQPVSKEYKSKLIIPDYLKRRPEKDISIVRFKGSCNTNYWDVYLRDVRDDDRIEPGDKVIMDKDCNIPLEPEEHLTFNGDKEYYIVERKNIQGIIKD